MKFKSLGIVSLFFIISLFGIFSAFSDARAATGDCNCWVGARATHSWTSSAGTPCTSVAECTTHCKAEAPSPWGADPNETTGDCVGFSAEEETAAATPPPQSIQCETVNPECTAAWDRGEETSRFISSRNCYCCGDCGFNDIVGIFLNAADFLFGILGALALLFFIYGGLVWLTSGGSAGQIDKGKKILLGAVIGMLLALGAWLIVKFLVTALGVTTPVTGF